MRSKIDALQNGKMTAPENIKGFLEEINKNDRDIKAFLSINPEAEKEAKAIQKKIENGTAGRLAGLAIGIKSNINVRGLKATCASKTLENYISPYDATVIERIKKEDGIIIGMTNMDEFACGSSGETSFFGATKNPAALDRIPGGSSSGSAAAVAAGFCDMALGSDTGGSIRNPASHTGVIGFKPTYGRVPRYGLIDLAMSLDQIGPFSKDVYSSALMLEAISGFNPREETSSQAPVGNYANELNDDITGMRIGIPKEFKDITDEKIFDKIMESARLLESKGAKLVELSLPNLLNGIPTYYLTVFVEFFSATRKFDGRRYGNKIEQVCGKEVLSRILLGKYISQKEYSGKYYKKALQFRSLIKNEMLDALKDVDLIAGPTTPKLPHILGEEIDTMSMYAYDMLTVPANLAGIPAGVINAGQVDGVPVGIQFQGKPLEEQKLLDTMYCLEVSR